METVLLYILAFPLLGSLVNGLILKPKVRLAGAIATGAALASFVGTLFVYAHLLKTGLPLKFAFEWFSVGELRVQWGFSFDALTAVMALVVTGIGTLIHLYSIGYMADDATPSRYFSYLNLFLFNMLVLIFGDNLPVLFVGWEGVGLCSYLLIGYWYEDIAKSRAGSKAFIVNRIGDACFLIGMFVCFYALGSLEFAKMAEVIGTTEPNLQLLNIGALFLFLGATGKSAQLPLFVWLPDAMAGPTPVSALIHAATMVTAGIYMIARMSPLFQVASEVMPLIAFIGAWTAVFAATIATAQRDIKKVLAYSTVSQLGFMFIALGVGAYSAAVFHLMTHAFFKALLFLGAGSVIHGLGGEQDVCKMGGLRKKLPVTFWTFLVATIAICGLPPFAGFFSKDMILFSALSSPVGNTSLWVLGSFASLLTAFYMTRLLLLVFFGEYRGDKHPHESPSVMLIPLVVLAGGSVFAGFVGMPHGLHLLPDYFSEFLAASVPRFVETEAFLSETGAMFIAVGVALFGMAVAVFFYYPSPAKSEAMASKMRGLQTVLFNKYWIDEFYGLVFVYPFELVSGFFARWFDPKVVDGAVHIPVWFCRVGSTLLSFVQFGAAQFYLWVMVVGAAGVFYLMLRGLII